MVLKPWWFLKLGIHGSPIPIIAKGFPSVACIFIAFAKIWACHFLVFSCLNGNSLPSNFTRKFSPIQNNMSFFLGGQWFEPYQHSLVATIQFILAPHHVGHYYFVECQLLTTGAYFVRNFTGGAAATSYRLCHTPFSLKFTPTCTMCYSYRVYPPYVQHLKVLKHFVYIQYGCGMQSMGVFSLNHDLTTSFRLSHTPFFLKFAPTCTCITA